MTVNWEVGSEFHWMEFTQNNRVKWDPNAVFCALGRTPILLLWQALTLQDKTLFVPEYFCPEVVACWLKHNVKLKFYRDDPLAESADFASITAKSGDMILAVNYFGIRSADAWKDWKANNKDILLVEDHTHDPVSDWAESSTADYAFSSLRKTLPVSDGAILWSPANRVLPAINLLNDVSSSNAKLAAMLLKKEYLTTGQQCLKPLFRQLHVAGEEGFGVSVFNAISSCSMALLGPGYPKAWRDQRLANVRSFNTLIESCKFFNVISKQIPSGACPFGAILTFDSQLYRDRFRQGLIRNNIYASIHWTDAESNVREGRKLSDHILTIPLDQRYDQDDVKQICSLVTSLILEIDKDIC